MTKQPKVVFMGTPDFAVPPLNALVEDGYLIACVVTQPDRPRGRKQRLTPPPVKVAAQNHGLEVWQPESIRASEAVERLRTFSPDLIVTVAYGQILPKSVLDMPAHGCINVHASLLPKYRGGAPIHWALINGERETGVTLMYMVEALDAGDILTQRRVPITADDTAGSLHDKLSKAGAELLRKSLPSILRGDVTPTPQDDALATYAPNVTRADERIDWTQSAEAIVNRIRGLNPWPVAYTTLNGNIFKIWRAEPVQSQASAPPGTVVRVDERAIHVSAGKGEVRLLEVQPAGKKRMGTDQFLRGTKIIDGMKLGGSDE